MRVVGVVLIVVGAIIVLAACLWLYFASKYKFAAAAIGVSSGISLVSDAWNS